MRENPCRSISPNGTEIFIEYVPNVKSCSVGFCVKRGSIHEKPAEEGLAHFIEHTVFKGTDHYPDPTAMSAATDALGGNLDAFTGKEDACFYGKVLSERLPQLVNILGDLVTTPRFEPEEVQREQSVILEEIAQSEDQPDDWVSEIFYMNFWRGGSLSHSVLGRPEQVKTYGSEQARSFFEKTYQAPNLMVAAAGDLKAERLLEMLQPILERLPKGNSSEPTSKNSPNVFLLNVPRKDLIQTSLILGLPVCGHKHPDRVALSLLSHILGGSPSSRLFMELREKHALCYQVGCFLSHYSDCGALQIAASCAQDKARELVKRSADECIRLARQGVNQDELDRAKIHAQTNLVFSLESVSSRMFSLAYQALHMDRIRNLDEQIKEINAVDLDKLNQVAEETLSPDRFSVAALGTKKGREIRPEDLKG